MDGAYEGFLRRKAIIDPATGLTGAMPDLPSMMFPFQTDIVRWALKRGRAAIFAGTGLGKSLMEMAWGKAVHEATGRDVLLLTPLAVAPQFVREAAKFSIVVHHVASQAEFVSGQAVTNYHKLDHFDLSKFGGVILDECFAPGTEIDCVNLDGSILKKDISRVAVGDQIANASGVDVVSDIHRREVQYGIAVSYAGNRIICSPNHPWFTGRGWVGAQDLIPGDRLVSTSEAMRMVRGDGDNKVSVGEEKTLLRDILLSEMADETTGYTGQGSFRRGREETRRKEECVAGVGCTQCREGIGAHCQPQPVIAAGRSGEDLPHIESHEPRTFRAWGKWSGDDAAASLHGVHSVRRMESGICRIVGITDGGLSNALQARLGAARAENRYRSGWSIAHEPPPSGQQEGQDAVFTRVDGIEVLEPGHPDLERYRDAEGHIYFYDLGGTRHPSFSVAGHLVHNSSILKNETGIYRNMLIEKCAKIPFRLAATATPAPNDFMELGNHAEFLGVMRYTDMLATFFSHDGGETQKWRLKGHAEDEFWKWMCSWSVMLRKPSDLGYDNAGYDLPPLHQIQHTVAVDYAPSIEAGTLFPMQAISMSERLAARRDTITERVRMAAAITPTDQPFLWWCNLNAESTALAKATGAVELSGSDSEDEKARKILAFCDGTIRGLVTKPSLAGFGVNMQHCAWTGFVGLNDSFEQIYQAVRRFWRFGQTREVYAHFIAAETEGAVVANIKRKEHDFERMCASMVRHMADLSAMAVRGAVRDTPNYNPTQPVRLPSWLN